MADIKREHVIVAGLLAAAGVLFYVAHNGAGGSRPPKYATTEDVAVTPDPVQPLVVQPEAGYLVTQHRFPHRVGHEISVMIEGGHSVASVPKFAEAYWIDKPPSELIL